MSRRSPAPVLSPLLFLLCVLSPMSQSCCRSPVFAVALGEPNSDFRLCALTSLPFFLVFPFLVGGGTGGTGQAGAERGGGEPKKGKRKRTGGRSVHTDGNANSAHPVQRRRQGCSSKTERQGSAHTTEKAAERGQAWESDVTCEVSQDRTERSFEWAQIVRIS